MAAYDHLDKPAYTLPPVANAATAVARAPAGPAPPAMMLALLAISAASPGFAQDTAIPPLRDGLWEMESTTAVEPHPHGGAMRVPPVGGPFTSRMCVDAAVQQHTNVLVRGGLGGRCKTTQPIRGTDGDFSYESSCPDLEGRPRIRIVGTVRGDFQTSVEQVVSSVPDVASTPVLTIRVRGRYAGGCPADMKPGDMVAPNGNRLSLLPAERDTAPQ